MDILWLLILAMGVIVLATTWYIYTRIGDDDMPEDQAVWMREDV